MNEARALRRPLGYGPGRRDEQFGRRGMGTYPRRDALLEDETSSASAIASVGAKLFGAVVWCAAAGFAIYLIHEVWVSMTASLAGALK